MLYDTVIHDGLIFDGTGKAPLQGWVGLKDGKISTVAAGPAPALEGVPRIDASGCWVTPGFIDLHTHYDA